MQMHTYSMYYFRRATACRPYDPRYVVPSSRKTIAVCAAPARGCKQPACFAAV